MSTRTKPWSRRAKAARKHGHLKDGRKRHNNNMASSDVPMAPRHDVHKQCTGKKTYSSQVVRKVADDMNRRNEDPSSEFHGLTVRAYTCPWCGSCHIGRFASMGTLELSPVDLP